MKELVKKFDEAQHRIKKLKIYRDAAGLSSQSTTKRQRHHKQYHVGSFHESELNHRENMDATMKIGASQQLSTIEMSGIKQFQTL